MEASSGPPILPTSPAEPNIEKIKQKLLRKGVYPTPKIIHTLRKKELQKSIRKSNRRLASQPKSLTESQSQALAEDAYFQNLKAEYKRFTRAISDKTNKNGLSMVGKPWERLESAQLRQLASSSKEYVGEKLKPEHLRELSEILERDRVKFRWLLDDDIELKEGWMESGGQNWAPPKTIRSEAEAIRFLVDKLSCADLSLKDWKFSRMMKKSGLQFTEGQLLKIVEHLGKKGQWRPALFVVDSVYSLKEHRYYKSRFVYTKLLAVLGKARRPREALQIFDLMREDCQLYPDMAAYHTIAVTLGQTGFLKELLNIIECMKVKPVKKLKNMRHKNWDPMLQPDLVVFNAVLNACVPTRQWKGVSWVFEQLRKNGLKPNGATYGLAMEVMLQSGKFDLVHKLYGKMRRSGQAPKALTYRVLVRTFWEENKVDQAVKAVREMEQRGVFGLPCVYYELACCLCNKGRWQEAMLEVEKLKKLPCAKPLEVTFTGMILSAMDGGHIDNCISMFRLIKGQGVLDIGIINIMLKIYGKNDMFARAKELFEEIKRVKSESGPSMDGFNSSLSPDAFTYRIMLEASASASQWEYFEYVYREMALSGLLLDQSQLAFLLVEASKAGKWHLLEHAFDTSLEAGEIPLPSVFTELICQAVIQHDYERVVSILNAMAHAPFQVSEKQWTDLFEINGDRISEENLKELFETLSDYDLPMEATLTNLSRSLFSLFRSNNQGVISRSVASSNNNGRLIYGLDRDRKPNQPSSLEDLAADLASDELDEGQSGTFSDRTEDGDLDIEKYELGMPASEACDSNASIIPPAEEILKSWKRSRNGDGSIFSFQLG
ncbi:hypothetical protein NMG60_11005985 [Bertholletia excelsa]